MMPKVTNDTIDSTLATLRDEDDYAKNTIEEIRMNNPVLFSLLETVTVHKNEEYIKGYLVGASQFYSLISRQMESDFLDNSL